MNSSYYYSVSALFNGLFAAFLVYYIYLRNRKNPINQSFMYFGITVSGWSLIYALWCLADTPERAEFFIRGYMVFCAFIPATFFHFIIQITQNHEKFKKVKFFLYGVSLFWAISAFTTLLIEGVKPNAFFHFWPKPGKLLLAQVIYYVLVVLFSFGLIVKRFFQAQGIEKRQMAWICAAFTVGFSGGSINWLPWFDIDIPPTTHFFVGITFALIAYAMVRHGLMDVDAMVEILRSSRTATLGLLASSLNHELRDPLYVAKGRMESHLDAVERQIYTEPEKEIAKSREIIQAAVAQLDRAMDIVQRFTHFARPYKMEEPRQDVVIAELVKDVLSFTAYELEFQKVRIAAQPSSGISLRVHRRQMEEVLFNLILNACQAIKTGGGTQEAGNEPEGSIRISAEEAGGQVRVIVADDGPGISEENQKRIFDPFFSTKGKDGTGLGLYITQQLVERNGGKISVKSKVGQGTSFVLEFKK